MNEIKKGMKIKAFVNGENKNLVFIGLFLSYEYPFITIRDDKDNHKRLLCVNSISNIEIL